MPSIPKTSQVWVIVARGKIPIQCTLTYSSRNIGQLTFEKETFVPDRFAISSSFRSRRSRSCRVTWRKGNEVGFEYIVDKVPPMQQRSEKL